MRSCLSAGYILGLESWIEFDLDVIQWLFVFIEYIIMSKQLGGFDNKNKV
jgi:hypothetical protein